MTLLSAVLMILSGISHNTPMLQGNRSSRDIGSSVFGICYLVIGAGLFVEAKAAFIAGAVIPLIGLVLGSIVYIQGDRKKTTLVHLAIDVVVVAVCIRWLFF